MEGEGSNCIQHSPQFPGSKAPETMIAAFESVSDTIRRSGFGD